MTVHESGCCTLKIVLLGLAFVPAISFGAPEYKTRGCETFYVDIKLLDEKIDGPLRTISERNVTTYEQIYPGKVEECRREIAEYAAEVERLKTAPLLRIGMTKAQVENSRWGRPDKINYTTTANMNHEQWVYGDGQYLYFRNGKLTAIQQ